MSTQPETVASFAAEKLKRAQALRLQVGITNNVHAVGSKKSSDVEDRVGTKRALVEGLAGEEPLFPRIRELEAEVKAKDHELVGMRLSFVQKTKEIGHLKELVTERETEVTKHLNSMADKSRELDELKASTRGGNMSSPTSLIDIACNMPGFIIEATRGALVCSGMFEGQPRQPALPGKILAQLNPCFVPRYVIIECTRNFKDLYGFLQKNYGAVMPDIKLLDTTSKARRNVIADYFRVNLCAYTGNDAQEFIDPYVEVAFGMQLCMDTSAFGMQLCMDTG